MKNIPLFYPYIPKFRVLKELIGTIWSRWLGQGPKVARFEKEFGNKFGYKYPLFVNSGTSALELAYHLVGLKDGDEVIVPVLDCTAGQTGLVRRGVKIVFADIDVLNFNISYEDVKNKITGRTRAIIAVDLGGIPYDERIFALARELGIKVIVDASQHHSPEVRPGDYVCYSFQAIKHLTTCDGGMLCLSNEEEYKRAKLLRWFGIDRDAKERHNYQAWERREMTFDIEEAGYKMQPTDVDACFGLAGLKVLDKVIKYRKELAAEYQDYMADSTILFKHMRLVHGGSEWLMGISADNRDDLADFLRANGVDVNMVHLRNDIFDVFKKFKTDCPVMDAIHERYLYLPLNMKVTKKDVRYIMSKIEEFYAR